ncbi:hypothetical protein EDC01DRAFT_622768 [Geopyxis carbonaria]|nr:hypothetical protein EDC01DRAFT_622768 [Geopyxis carbonaria]
MDDFAQTRGAEDLFESEISAQPSPPPTAPREPRGNLAKGRGSSTYDKGYYQPTRDANSQQDEIHLNRKEQIRSGDKIDTVPKLTDEELAARMERVKLNNQRLTERRRKAEEDETKFQAQEEARKKNDAVKRFADRKKKVEQEKNRRELDEEREKNRQRKLKAVQNREWDSEKKEEDYNPSGYSSKYRKGIHGGVSAIPSSNNNQTTTKPKQTEAEWPTLPENKNTPSKDCSSNLLPLSPAVDGSSWAEQVEAGCPTTPH